MVTMSENEMPLLQDLPNEGLLSIADHVDQEWDLNSLAIMRCLTLFGTVTQCHSRSDICSGLGGKAWVPAGSAAVAACGFNVSGRVENLLHTGNNRSEKQDGGKDYSILAQEGSIQIINIKSTTVLDTAIIKTRQ